MKKPVLQELNVIARQVPGDFIPLLDRRLLHDSQTVQVVWARVKGYPFWPAQVLDETAARKRLSAVSHRKSQDVPVQFFGTLEVAWIGNQDIVPFRDGVQLGYLTKGKHKNFVKACLQVYEFLVPDKKRKATPGWWCRAPDPGFDGIEAGDDSVKAALAGHGSTPSGKRGRKAVKEKAANSDAEDAEDEDDKEGGVEDDDKDGEPPKKKPRADGAQHAQHADAAGANGESTVSKQAVPAGSSPTAGAAGIAASTAALQPSSIDADGFKLPAEIRRLAGIKIPHKKTVPQESAVPVRPSASGTHVNAADALKREGEQGGVDSPCKDPAPNEQLDGSDPASPSFQQRQASGALPTSAGSPADKAFNSGDPHSKRVRRRKKQYAKPIDSEADGGDNPANNVETRQKNESDESDVEDDDGAEQGVTGKQMGPRKNIGGAGRGSGKLHSGGELDFNGVSGIKTKQPNNVHRAPSSSCPSSPTGASHPQEGPSNAYAWSKPAPVGKPPRPANHSRQQSKEAKGFKPRRTYDWNNQNLSDSEMNKPLFPSVLACKDPSAKLVPTDSQRESSQKGRSGSKGLTSRRSESPGISSDTPQATGVNEQAVDQQVSGQLKRSGSATDVDMMDAEAAEALQFMLRSGKADSVPGAKAGSEQRDAQQLERAGSEAVSGKEDEGAEGNGRGHLTRSRTHSLPAQVKERQDAERPLVERLEAILGTNNTDQEIKVPRKSGPQECADFKWPHDLIELPDDQEEFFMPKEWLVARPPKYEAIRRSIWLCKNKPKKLHREDVNVCACEGPGYDKVCCGADCLNRLSFVICDPKHCPNGDQCQNKPFQFLKTPRVEAFVTENGRGWGARPLEFISSGTFIMEYVGEVIDEKQLAVRMDTARDSGQHSYYIMEVQPGIYIDARLKGNLSRLLNSSCQPNCETQKWHDAGTGEMRIGIFAKRDIAPMEELTYDYFFEQYSRNGVFNTAFFKCTCGAPNCRGTMDNPALNSGKNKDFGRRVEIYNVDLQYWVTGTVVGYSISTKRHTIVYDDGSQEKVLLDGVKYHWRTDGPLSPGGGQQIVVKGNNRRRQVSANMDSYGGRTSDDPEDVDDEGHVGQGRGGRGRGSSATRTDDTSAVRARNGVSVAAALAASAPTRKRQRRGASEAGDSAAAAAVLGGSERAHLATGRTGLDNSHNSTSTTYAAANGIHHAASAPAGITNRVSIRGKDHGKDMESLLQAVENELQEDQEVAAHVYNNTSSMQPGSGRRRSQQQSRSQFDNDGGMYNIDSSTLFSAKNSMKLSQDGKGLPTGPMPRTVHSLPGSSNGLRSSAAAHATAADRVRSPNRRRNNMHAEKQAEPSAFENHNAQLDRSGSAYDEPVLAQTKLENHSPPEAAGSRAKVAVIEEFLGIPISTFDVPLFTSSANPASPSQRALLQAHAENIPPHLLRGPVTTMSPGAHHHDAPSRSTSAMLPNVSSAVPGATAPPQPALFKPPPTPPGAPPLFMPTPAATPADQDAKLRVMSCKDAVVDGHAIKLESDSANAVEMKSDRDVSPTSAQLAEGSVASGQPTSRTPADAEVIVVEHPSHGVCLQQEMRVKHEPPVNAGNADVDMHAADALAVGQAEKALRMNMLNAIANSPVLMAMTNFDAVGACRPLFSGSMDLFKSGVNHTTQQVAISATGHAAAVNQNVGM